MTDRLFELLPEDYSAEQSVKPTFAVGVDIEVEKKRDEISPWFSKWQPGNCHSVKAVLPPERFELRIFRSFGGQQLVATIELISPNDKDCIETREAFAMKVASYLRNGVCVAIVDVITEQKGNLHDLIIRMMRMPMELKLPADSSLYAATYRPVLREGRTEIDIWVNAFSVGDPLPTMPLRLIADYFVPLELEATYMETCRRRRIIK